jgi:hypothetical protein
LLLVVVEEPDLEFILDGHRVVVEQVDLELVQDYQYQKEHIVYK